MNKFHLLFILLFISIVSCSQIVGGSPQVVEDVFLPEGDRINIEIWVDNLEIPWSLVFLPDNRALVSERPGRIRLIKSGSLQKIPYAEIDVAHFGEGGLLGLAVDPSFPEKPYIYAMYTIRKEERLANRIVRIKDNGSSGTFDKVIIDDLPAGKFHNGGRIAFGPDGMLYATTGDSFNSDLAQNLKSLGGKILRITPEGNIPADNPFKESSVYSYGHRNPQGLSWQPGTRNLFESEHGPSGEFGHFAHDEINVIEQGGNYGWPKVIGAPKLKPYIDPIIVWKNTTPPSGITFYKGNSLKHLKGDLFVATLKSQALIRIRFDDKNNSVVRIEKWFTSSDNRAKFGRLRDVVEGPDGALYILTSNRDGRGNPRDGDDKIYRITP